MLKMSELVKQSGESKSTLIYYLNKGLLPQPKKPKKNIALYDEKCLEIIKFIRYFQKSLYYSINQIKDIIDKNTINFHNGVDMIISSLSVISIGNKEFSVADVLQKTQISQTQLQAFQALELIRIDDFYSQKDIDIIIILTKSGQTLDLLKYYVKSAKELAKLESQIGSDLLQKISKNNSIHQLIFDTVLKVKPYIFNNHTLLENKHTNNEKEKQ
jgi:DNA-binding transcriptional MerR regulator